MIDENAIPKLENKSLPTLPSHWKWVRFDNFCKRVSVGHVGPTEKFFTERDRGVPLIRSQNVRPGNLEIDNVAYITNEFHAKLKKSQLQPGDVLIVRVGANRSDCCVLPDDIGEINCANIVFARPESSGEFFAYYFQTYFGRKMLLASTTGAAQEVINTGSVAGMPVPLPPKKEREDIISVISSYEKLLKNNHRRIQLLEESARLIYKEWFVHLRFPGHEHVKVKDGVPEGWQRSSLGEVVEIKKGKNITLATVEEGDIPVVAGGLSPAYFHSKANVTGPVITVSASGANAGHVALYQRDIWASDCSFIGVESDPFLYFRYLQLKYYQEAIFSMQHGAAQPHVYPKDLARLVVLKPSESLLNEFISLVTDQFLLVRKLENTNAQLERARDLLLPRLMSGELAV